MTTSELIDLINNHKEKRGYYVLSLDEAEDSIMAVCKENDDMARPCKVSSQQNVDSHRWYEIATDVYKCADGFVGVSGVSQLLSEMESLEDVNVVCCVEEYEAIPSISYKRKKLKC